jgi:hypothetical protein
VTCDASPLFTEPVVSDALGVLAFEVDGSQYPPPNSICVSTDGSPPPLRVEDERACETTEDSAVICWRTNRPATSQVEYEATVAGLEFGPDDRYGNRTEVDSTLTKTHIMTAAGLEPGSTYHFRAISTERTAPSPSPGTSPRPHSIST